ncbi:MAG: hypothetical protein HQ561_15970 [Desulfobacteraceae bacterium]|nr:hypothetical protein [Desulfobacteraceae bacterium]
MDFVAYNPFMDNKGAQTARLLKRTMLQCITGIAMGKKRIDPDHISKYVTGEVDK